MMGKKDVMVGTREAKSHSIYDQEAERDECGCSACSFLFTQ